MPYDPNQLRMTNQFNQTRRSPWEQDVIPTGFADPGEKTYFTNEDLTSRQPMRSLIDLVREQDAQTAARLQGLDMGPTNDERMAAANRTLNETQPQASRFAEIANPRVMQTAEMHAPKVTPVRDTLRNAARMAQTAGFALSPFIGASIPLLAAPASVYLAGEGLLSAGENLAEGNVGSAAGDTALAALDALGAYGTVRGMANQLPVRVTPTTGGPGFSVPPASAARSAAMNTMAGRNIRTAGPYAPVGQRAEEVYQLPRALATESQFGAQAGQRPGYGMIDAAMTAPPPPTRPGFGLIDASMTAPPPTPPTFYPEQSLGWIDAAQRAPRATPNLQVQGNVLTPGPSGFGSPSTPSEPAMFRRGESQDPQFMRELLDFLAGVGNPQVR